MDTVAAVFADFQSGFLGGRSPLDDRLVDRTILHHTLDRVARVEGVDRRCVMVRPEEESAARSRLAECGVAGVDVLPLDVGGRPRRELIRSARKWSLESWRGNLCCATWFDEFADPLAAAHVLDHYRCDAVLCVSACQPRLDPAIASAMIARKNAHGDDAKLVFTQAPPGVAGIVLRRDVTRELLQQETPVGVLMGYRPENPQGDPIARPVCAPVADVVAQTPARLTGDTRRSRELLAAAAGELGDQADSAAILSWIQVNRGRRAEPFPTEIEIELTTEDSLPETMLRPRGDRVPRRVLDDAEAVARVAADAAAYDDTCIVLGGFGDPLLHPRFGEIVRRIRDAGVCGIAVTTPLVRLSDDAQEAIFAAKVDVVEVLLDANCRDTYRTIHRADHFEQVVTNIERVLAERIRRSSPQPLLACSLTRHAATLNDMDGFFDRWIRSAGSAVIRGYDRFGGALPADSLIALTPRSRTNCRRIGSRMSLLADGSATVCSEDIAGRMVVGDWRSEAVGAIWLGPAMERVRDAHRRGGWDGLPVCGKCEEWFRT